VVVVPSDSAGLPVTRASRKTPLFSFCFLSHCLRGSWILQDVAGYLKDKVLIWESTSWVADQVSKMSAPYPCPGFSPLACFLSGTGPVLCRVLEQHLAPRALLPWGRRKSQLQLHSHRVFSVKPCSVQAVPKTELLCKGLSKTRSMKRRASAVPPGPA